MAIKKCSCDHEYQDSKHGKKMRVFNKKSDGRLVCTVCRSETGDSISPHDIMMAKKAAEEV